MCVTQWQVSQWLFLHPGSHGQYSSQTKNSNSFQGPVRGSPPVPWASWCAGLVNPFCLAEGSTSGAMSHVAIQDKAWLSMGLVLLLGHHLTVHMNCGEKVAYLSSVLRERCEAVSTLKGSFKGDAPKIHNLGYFCCTSLCLSRAHLLLTASLLGKQDSLSEGEKRSHRKS